MKCEFSKHQKVLVIGSAPYMPEWWKVNGKAYRSRGFVVAAINNSWAIPTDGLPEIWIRPWDYFLTSPKEMHPPKAATPYMETVGTDQYNRLKKPVWYTEKGGGTMVLNTLCYMVNRLLLVDGGTLVFAGCDLNYSNLRTHFYNGGKPDPLKHGIEWIQEEMNKLVVALKQYPVEILNAGWSEKTVLPFPRINGDTI